ncbi:MAG: enoyl-CoA hydratase-related protein [SAR324 cluster bacterium]|nr:enoyl-CoA hydratase-related protein [SAR324 cluster bacterium]
MSENLKFEIDNGIATITLNRPEKLNAFTPDMLEAWLAAYRECRDSDAVNVVVLTGAGRGFCSGGDVARMGDSADASPMDAKTRLASSVQQLPLTLAEMDKPVLAAVNGVATGAGMDVALMCDMRIAAESARFAETYVKIGIVPGAGGAYFLPRLVGYTKALEMLLTGDFVDAQEALRIGLVNQVVPDDQLMEKTYELARKISSNAPLSVRLIKRAMVQGLSMDLRSHLDQISSHMGVVRGSEDHKEALAAFKEKRTPVFKGR